MRRRRPVIWALAAAALIALVASHSAHADPAAAGAACGSAFDDYQQRGWAWMYLGSFGFGFLTSLTPCVYPMIPITLAIFGARGGDVSKRRAILLATAYVVGMGLTYAILGVSIAMLGKTTDFGSQLNSPYVVIPIVLLFCVLAASLFGAFNLQLPSSIQLRLNQIGGKGFGGAFSMGLVGGLIAAPCTGPFLLGLLTFVAKSRNVAAGGSLLFVYALGMGVLFWALAAFAMSLPKSGAWMDTTKSIGGMLLVFAGVYFLQPLIPAMKDAVPSDTWFIAVGIGMIVIGVLMGAAQRTFHDGLRDAVLKGAGIALVVVGASSLWVWHLAPKQHLPWLHDEQAAYAQAAAEHKGVMVDFSATWCGPCQKLEKTFGDDDVYAAVLDHFVPLKLDVSANDDAADAAKARYDALVLPTVAFRTPTNTDIGHIAGESIGQDELLATVRSSANALVTGTLSAKCD